jgi:hypothetical protein
MLKRTPLLALGIAALVATSWSNSGNAGVNLPNGLNLANGLSTNGLSTNGLSTNGLSTNGFNLSNGLSTNDLSSNGILLTNGLTTLRAVRLVMPDGTDLAFR